jgi:hypothetical protein
MTEPSQSSQDIGSARPRRIGLLFVHGIGNQAGGDTLLQCGEPLLRWVRRWLSQLPQEHGDISVIESHLISSEGDVMPGHAIAELSLSSSEGGRHIERWVLAESTWAKKVHQPSFQNIAGWMLTVGTWMLLSYGIRSPHERNKLDWRHIADVILILLSVAAAVVIQVLIIILALLAILPIPRLRAALSNTLLLLTGFLGDSYVLLESEMQRKAIVAKVRKDLDWIAAKCDLVAVIAHSQGAAVAHRALRSKEPENISLFITYGSGLAKLEQLKLMSEINRGILRLAYLAAPVAFVSTIIDVRVYLRFLDVPLAVAGAIFLAIVAIGLMWTLISEMQRDQPRLEEEMERLSLQGIRPNLKWLDLSSSADLISNSSLQPKHGHIGGYEFRTVTNIRNIFLDHTWYWKNQADFIPAVVQELALSLSRLNIFVPNSTKILEDAAKKHASCVSWLVLTRLASASAVILIATAFSSELARLGMRFRGWLSDGAILKWISEGIADLLRSHPSPWVWYVALGSLFPLSLVILWHLSYGILWRWWDKLAIDRIVDGSWPRDRADQVAVDFFVIGCGLVPLGLALLFILQPDIRSVSGLEKTTYISMGVAFLGVFWLLFFATTIKSLTEVAEVIRTGAYETARNQEWLLENIVVPLVCFSLALGMTLHFVPHLHPRSDSPTLLIFILLSGCLFLMHLWDLNKLSDSKFVISIAAVLPLVLFLGLAVWASRVIPAGLIGSFPEFSGLSFFIFLFCMMITNFLLKRHLNRDRKLSPKT